MNCQATQPKPCELTSTEIEHVSGGRDLVIVELYHWFYHGDDRRPYDVFTGKPVGLIPPEINES